MTEIVYKMTLAVHYIGNREIVLKLFVTRLHCNHHIRRAAPGGFICYLVLV